LVGSNNELNSDAVIEILDYTGRKIKETPLQIPLTTINLSTFSKGLYIARIISGGQISNYKIIYN